MPRRFNNSLNYVDITTGLSSYADISRFLAYLSERNIPCKWTNHCHLAFNTFKTSLYIQPLLINPYPDVTLAIYIYTDTSKYSQANLLMQKCTDKDSTGKTVYTYQAVNNGILPLLGRL